MKKILVVVLSLLCVLSIAFTMISCDTEENVSTDPKTESNDSSAFVEETESSEPADNGKVTYTVTVVDENNAPIEGIIIQFCDDENCKLPLVTDTDGKATAEYDESNYHVTITEATGYSYEDEYNFEDGTTEITIVLTAQD